jgi:molybdate transport system substrate-binding protein
MKRRVPTTAASVTVLAIALAGCTSSKSATGTPTDTSTATAASTSAASSTAPSRSTASPSTASPSTASPSTATSSSSLSGKIVVFAAASLKNTFTTLAADFEQSNPGVTVVPSYAGSDTLAAQITQGAPVDVFAAASTSTMGAITAAGDTADTPVVFAKNELEIAVAPGNPKHIGALADLTNKGVKLALCASTVPCGAAASKAFAAAKLKPHPVTLEQDVTSVLTKVELGEVDAGIVYQTDVKSAGAKVAGVNFAEAPSAINAYPISVIKNAKNPTVAQAFVAYVLSSVGQQILQAAGFRPPQ